MYWIALVLLGLLTLPLNERLLRHVWWEWYPPTVRDIIGELMGPEFVSTGYIMRAQARAVLCFALVQPAMAAVPLLLGSEWYHWVAGALASTAFCASGSPTTFIDRVRSSHLQWAASLTIYLLVGWALVSVQG